MKLAASVTFVWLLFVCATPAFAYVDPGSGSMMIQLLLGGVAGAAVLARIYWRRILTFVRPRKPPTDTTQ